MIVVAAVLQAVPDSADSSYDLGSGYYPPGVTDSNGNTYGSASQATVDYLDKDWARHPSYNDALCNQWAQNPGNYDFAMKYNTNISSFSPDVSYTDINEFMGFHCTVYRR